MFGVSNRVNIAQILPILFVQRRREGREYKSDQKKPYIMAGEKTASPGSKVAQDAEPSETADGVVGNKRLRWVTNRGDFRARAHSNPYNDGLFNPPQDPSKLPFDQLFQDPISKTVDWCDIGCGYGGLLASLAPEFPEKTMIGLEIRDRVADFCRQRVLQMREEYKGEYGNIAFERTNVMKYLPNYFGKASLEKMFFCYPDPHFKKRKNRQRIITTQLLAEYAYVMKEGGVAYIVTDVEELFHWMVERFQKHPLFKRRSDEEHAADKVTAFVRDMTDEAQRVEKKNSSKFDASFMRIKNP